MKKPREILKYLKSVSSFVKRKANFKDSERLIYKRKFLEIQEYLEVSI